ncbi:MAG: RsmD family RNA methyltransferase, partial [Formivibrio sp.]|nr:RsmD family RNA methyltransferase [Formivibrio sp.]
LRSNQSTLDARNLEIVWSDGMRFLDSTPERFDVVFLDPPFASDLLASALQRLPRILKDGAMVYAECARWPELAGWEIIKEGHAGQVQYGLLRRAETVE